MKRRGWWRRDEPTLKQRAAALETLKRDIPVLETLVANAGSHDDVIRMLSASREVARALNKLQKRNVPMSKWSRGWELVYRARHVAELVRAQGLAALV
jgi:hypothetical protein